MGLLCCLSCWYILQQYSSSKVSRSAERKLVREKRSHHAHTHVSHLREGKERWRWEVHTPTVRMHSPAKKSQFQTGLWTVQSYHHSAERKEGVKT